MENKRIVVAGGGHAGIEAALAIQKRGYDCVMITMSKDSIGRLSCNPAIGGLGKGHLVREIDALGGVMGSLADLTTLQHKVLNKSKGRAVWSPRSQVDKIQYTKKIQELINNSDKIDIIEDEVVNFNIKNNKIDSVILKKNGHLDCSALIITCGTFMSGLIHIGNKSFKGGRMGEKRSYGLTEALVDYGFTINRLKTGTPPRAYKESINWNKLEVADGELNPLPFSMFTPKPFTPKNVPCYLAYTTKKTHNIIKKNINSSAMFSGKISGVGPRYCPSIEDKVVRFEDRPQHQLFLEPEWEDANQIYINGFSTSLPETTQVEALRSIRGLEKIELIRPGYAIEYDYFPSHQLKSTLETKSFLGLFFAGQINGTSGYEEAAAQGLLAGVNSVSYVAKTEPLVLKRAESYIGVMVDDLITKSINEPYRMFTSRSENRLSLRAETAPLRLGPIAACYNLYTNKQFALFKKFQSSYKALLAIVEKERFVYNNKKEPLYDLLKRPDVSLEKLQGDNISKIYTSFSIDVIFAVETAIKYKGYEDREKKRNEKIKGMENHKIPPHINYKKILNLSTESKEKLSLVQPETLGQAGRIDGVRSSDIAVLLVYLTKTVSRETKSK
ncbi:tRNA uridine-5-carboxymethylaminomethyl(34) synthesis enzyme MnmG [bacterium]|nr:tRNA uridine-5-carboxymethylaminomethyl(34) synthesis enzyme MnmG [bacterium]